MSSREARELGGARTANLGFKLTFLALLLLTFLPKSKSQTVAMTVDDLPFASGNQRPLTPSDGKSALTANKKILRAFSRRHIPATGFVIEQNAERLGMDSSRRIFGRWIRPGFDLGNHLYSHPDINLLTEEQAEQEILRGESTIKPILQSAGREPRYLRFPYNHTAIRRGSTTPSLRSSRRTDIRWLHARSTTPITNSTKRTRLHSHDATCRRQQRSAPTISPIRRRRLIGIRN